ncbi:hypothetical protein [Flavobacterium sp. ASW18X]|uniref:hypothetical protein n=1 Tax=Flavobacterium sp. ASW18X TaxID=2572595 RepID=UPI0010ADB073|nr:hypothetical protein [Flavobacterium sp. ASW18X]TKD67032.1 hypothetical protein FBT53_00970 [Flavobacterium sp. ASW18X]
MKHLLITISVCLPFLCNAQKEILKLNNHLKTNKKKMQGTFPVVDKNTGEYTLFFDDKKNFYAYHIDSQNNVENSFLSEGLPKKYNEVIGHYKNGDKTMLFLKDKGNKKFGSILFDFDKQTSKEIVYDFKLQKESYVTSYSNEDNFYLVTIVNKSSVLNLYTFDFEGQYKKESIDLQGETFLSTQGKAIDLHKLMLSEGPKGTGTYTSNLDVVEISPESPNTIEITSESTKMYSKDSSFIISLDGGLDTYLLQIDPKAISYKLTAIARPSLTGEKINSNSFILDDNIHLIAATVDALKYEVKALNTKKIIKSYTVKEDEEISFKNTPIIQEGGRIKDYREMEKTAKLLRRLGKEYIGIAVEKLDDNYVVTIGSKKEISTGGGPGVSFVGVGGAAGAFTVGVIVPSYNPVFNSFNSYTKTKATRIECLFDANFNHLDGNIKNNVFEKINQDSEEIKSKSGETIFILNNKFIWGYYDKASNNYLLYEY